MKTKNKAIFSKIEIITFVLFFILIGCDVKSQNAYPPVKKNVAVRLIGYQVKPEFQEVLQIAIREYILYSHKKRSNILSEGYFEKDKPSALWIIERWSNKKALEKISNSPQFKALDSLSRIGTTHPVKTINANDLEPLSRRQWRKNPNDSDSPLTIMLFVDSKLGTEHQFKQLYHDAMPLFRSEGGVINYQLSQFIDDSTRFVTYEKFRNEDAFQFHLNFPPIRPVIDYLNTSIKEQPFQKGLHSLIEFVPVNRE